MTPHPDAYTIAQAAAELGRAQRTVRQLAQAHSLGRLVNSRLRLLSRADIEFLRGLKPGRPRATPVKD